MEVFVISKKKLEVSHDATRAVYIQMILKKMSSENELAIQSNQSTSQLAEEIIELLIAATGWFKDKSTKKKIKENILINEYTLRRTPAIELRKERIE